jgi:hypothetical protein
MVDHCGGGYVGDYSTNPSRKGTNHIISLVSFGDDKKFPGIGYGPYFTAELLSLLDYVKAGCKKP